MVTTELSEARIADLFSQIQVHDISVESLRLLIEADDNGMLSGVIFAKSNSGSTYELELLGPTVNAEYYGGIAKVRRVHYRRTRANGIQTEMTEYLGLTAGETLHMRFFSTLKNEVDSVEHSIMRIPTSEVLDPNIQLVIDWSK